MARSWWPRARAADRPAPHVGPRRIWPQGRAISGRGYYVWDEDPRSAADWARELDEVETPPPDSSRGDSSD